MASFGSSVSDLVFFASVTGFCSVVSVLLLAPDAGLVVLLVRKTSLILPAGDFDRLED